MKKTILITGAAGGVGTATARLLKHNNLILVDRNSKKLEVVAKELNAKSFICDVSNIKEVEKLKDYILKEVGCVDILINSAGLWTKGEISQLKDKHFKEINTLEHLKDLINTNTFGTIAMITIFAPLMAEKGKGQIINVCSQSAVETEEFCPVYNASKHGMYQYRKAIQRDLAKQNIKITDVCPGLINTDFYVNANDELPKQIMDLGLNALDVANMVNYLIGLPHEITIPSIEIRNIKNY